MNKEFIVMVVGRMLLAVSSILLLRIYTTLLSPMEVGKLNILQTLFSLITLTLITPVVMYYNRMAIEWDLEGRCQRYFLYFIIFLLIIGLISTIPVFYYEKAIGFDINVEIKLLLVMAAIVPALGGVQTTLFSVLNLLGNRVTYVALTNISNWGILIISSLMVVYINKSAEYWILGQQLAIFITIAMGFIIFKNKTKKEKIKIKIKMLYYSDESIQISKIIKYIIPYSIIMILYWLQIYCYQFILNKYDSLENVGYFVTGFKIGATPISIYDAILFQYLVSDYYRNVVGVNEKTKSEEWNKFAEKLLPLVMPIVLIVNCSADQITKLLVSDSFTASSKYIVWGSLTEALRVFSTLISQVAITQMKTSSLILPSLIPAVIVISLQIIFIEYNPLLATGVALVVGMAINVIISWSISKKLIPGIRLPWKSIILNIIFTIPLIILLYYQERNIIYMLNNIIDGVKYSEYISIIIYLMLSCIILIIPIYFNYKKKKYYD